MEEIWKTVKNYEGYYEVSSKGRVRSLDRIVISKVGRWGKSIKYPVKGRILSQSSSKRGYKQVLLSVNNIKETVKIHHLVIRAFVDKNYKFYYDNVIDHIDADPTNNNLSNLRLVTQRVNSYRGKPDSEIGYTKRGDRYESSIRYKKDKIYLGVFDSKEEANASYMGALRIINKLKKERHGENS